MDSTQFDYKNNSNDGFRAGYQRGNPKGNQRPTSAQSQKYGQNNLNAQYYEASSINNTNQHNNSFNQNRRPNTGAGGSRHNAPFNADLGRNPAESVIEELDGEEEARLIERATYNQPLQLQQLPDVQKLMPKNITLEKEKLYEDTLHLKQHINALREENLRLKTRNLNLERDNAKLGKAVEKGGNPGIQYGKQSESALLVALKKQVKEAKEELKIRVDELENMKRNTKFTRVQELEIELKAFIDENLRLKSLYEDLQNLKPQINPEDYSALEERCYLQNNLIESLQRDHERLSGEIRYLQQENYSLQTTLDVEVKATLKQKAEVAKVKKQLLTKDKELRNWQQYKLEIAPGNTSQNKGTSKPLLNESTHNNSTAGHHSPGKSGKSGHAKIKSGGGGGAPVETDDLQQILAEMTQLREQNKELEFKYVTMGGKQAQADNRAVVESISRQNDATKDKATLRNDMAKLRRQNKYLENEYNALMENDQNQPQNHAQAPKLSGAAKPVDQLQQQRPESKEQKSDPREQKSELKDYMPEPKVEQKPKTEGSTQLRPDRPESAKHEGRPRSAVKEVKDVKEAKTKLPPVKFEDAKQIVRGLALSLKLKRIPCGKALAALPKEGQLKLADARKLLTQIGIKDENEALLVTRYIYESGQEAVELDLNKVQDVSAIRGVLTELLDDYVLASEAQEEACKKELCEILYRYEQSIDTQFSILDDDCNGHLPEALITEAFTKLDIKLSQGALEHLVGRLYEDSGSLKKLNYERLFEIFENDIQKYSKQNTSKPTSKVEDKKPAATAAPPQDDDDDYDEEYKDDDQELDEYDVDEYENDEDQD